MGETSYIYSEATVRKAKGLTILDQLTKEKCTIEWQIIPLIENRDLYVKFSSYKAYD